MPDEVELHGWVNPAILFSLEPLLEKGAGQPEAAAVLRDLCSPDADASLEAMARRCQEVAPPRNPLGIVPAEKNILTKLIWPLRNARSCYVMGNYLGTIALSGMVAEMVAVVLFDIAEPSVEGRPLDAKHQVERFGCKFEKLGQKRRIEVLKQLGVLRGTIDKSFLKILSVRRRYLHFWSHDHGDVSADAAKACEAAVAVVVALMGIRFDHGKAILTPAMVKYLKKKGLYKPVEPPGQ